LPIVFGCSQSDNRISSLLGDLFECVFRMIKSGELTGFNATETLYISAREWKDKSKPYKELVSVTKEQVFKESGAGSEERVKRLFTKQDPPFLIQTHSKYPCVDFVEKQIGSDKVLYCSFKGRFFIF
jgi:hypothetical protein